MKNIKSILAAFIPLILITACFCFQSCSKRSTDDSNCVGELPQDTLRFNIVDKTTGQDLFFSEVPAYKTSDLYFVIDDMTANIYPEVSTTAESGRCFLLRLGGGKNGGILKTYIAGKLEFTIDYKRKEYKGGDCQRYMLDKLIVNGLEEQSDVRNRVVVFKK